MWTRRGEAGRLPAPSGASRHRPAWLTLDNERPGLRAARRPDTPQSVARKLENRNAVWRTLVRSGAAERWVVWHGGAGAAWRCSNSGVVTSVVSGDTRHPFMATGGVSEAVQPWIGQARILEDKNGLLEDEFWDARGADSFRYNSTDRQNPPIQKFNKVYFIKE